MEDYLLQFDEKKILHVIKIRNLLKIITWHLKNSEKLSQSDYFLLSY